MNFLPLLERKRHLVAIMRAVETRLLYVDHIAERGCDRISERYGVAVLGTCSHHPQSFSESIPLRSSPASINARARRIREHTVRLRDPRLRRPLSDQRWRAIPELRRQPGERSPSHDLCTRTGAPQFAG